MNITIRAKNPTEVKKIEKFLFKKFGETINYSWDKNNQYLNIEDAFNEDINVRGFSTYVNYLPAYSVEKAIEILSLGVHNGYALGVHNGYECRNYNLYIDPGFCKSDKPTIHFGCKTFELAPTLKLLEHFYLMDVDAVDNVQDITLLINNGDEVCLEELRDLYLVLSEYAKKVKGKRNLK